VSGKKLSLTILLDEGTPVLAASPFQARGYTVIHHANVLDVFTHPHFQRIGKWRGC
jgi:hypothetical protein